MNRTDFDVLIKYPLQTLALLLGGTAFTAGVGMLRHGHLEIAVALGVLASVILAGAGTMMLHSDAWEASDDEWGAVAIDPRQRLNFMVVSIGMVVVGVAAMWFGFGPGMLVARVLLIAGGSLLFLTGVIGFVGWLEAHRRFG